MNKKSGTSKDSADRLVKEIKCETRKHSSAEEKIRIVLAGLRGEAILHDLRTGVGGPVRTERARKSDSDGFQNSELNFNMYY